MHAAPPGPPSGIGPGSLLDSTNRLSARLPDSRFEIIGGVITATPLLNGPHADTLTTLTLALGAAGLHGKETRVLQGIGLRLPGSPEDYAIPDLAVVDADFLGAEVALDVDEIVRAGRPKRRGRV
ncbi:Uma2 family endonuclease [Streptomyces sp. B27]|uniref:Uma2 family endonuclease n=1 Tax=Streptomyces sp. B27 TaxID=2485015 RepID=UPI000FD8A048|nr:Uma2 family endonuclease [Streptomyces sp. B27]